MQRITRKWLRGWAGLALFATLALLSSPALAFACCCAPEVSATPAPQIPVAPVVAPPSHPGCPGHAEASSKIDSETAPNGAASRVSNSASISVVVATSSLPVGPCFESICDCDHTSHSFLAFVETQNGSAFAPLVMGNACPAFSLEGVLPSSIRFAFASNVARLRGPDVASRSDRGPPAFSQLS